MPGFRTLLLTSVAMLAFAGNSLLCRLALKNAAIDAASFTTLRLAAGMLMLGLLLKLRGSGTSRQGNWLSGLALFVYAAGFSFAYITLPASAGALLLFGAVQLTMTGYGYRYGERLRPFQLAGIGVALAGLLILLLPGMSAPPVVGSLLMLAAGAAWGIYSLRGRRPGDPLGVTAGNFRRAAILSAGLSLVALSRFSISGPGAIYAILSGALASGFGYVIWYAALRGLQAASAATVQLSVPVLAAAGGILLLQEPLTVRLAIAATAILGGIALAIRTGSPGVKRPARRRACIDPRMDDNRGNH